jgi:hypothetical protein
MLWDFCSSSDWGDLTSALAIRPVASQLFPEISSDREARPRADERDRRRGIRMFGCQSQTGSDERAVL